MPRFGIKLLLIGFTIATLWLLSTLIIDDQLGYDLRRAILLLILVASSSAAIYRAGWQRAYWTGFSAAMLITVAKVPGFSIELEWLNWPIGHLVALLAGNDPNTQNRIYPPLFWTGNFACILLLSTISGLIAAYIYSQNRSHK